MSSIIQALPFYLNAPLGASDTTIQVKGLKNSRGVAITAMPSGVALIHVTIEPKSPTNQEIISFTGITDNGNGVVTLTGVTRNLNPVSPFTALTADVPHANNSTCVISNNPQIFQDVVMTNEARTVSAVVTFGASPLIPDAVSANQPVSKSQLDLAVLGTVPASSTTVLGAVRVATDPTKTLSNVSLTIASPCVAGFSSHGLTANDTIRFTTTGALPTGLVVGTTYYVIATGLTANTFQLALTAGGSAINTTGSQSGTHTLYRTTPYAVNDQDTRLPTQGENDALVGTVGTPSSSNKYVTNDDTTGTGSVIRASKIKFGGTGADGALTISAGATNIDCASAQVVIKNYTSISITGTASLTFTNPHANGTIVILKSQGDVTLTSSTTPMIAMQNMGAAGGAGAIISGGTGQGSRGSDANCTTMQYSLSAGSGGQNNGGAGSPVVGAAPLLMVSGYGKSQSFMVGAGGGGGGDAGGGTAGAGGRGGGGIIIECAGAWNFTTASGISVAGQNGVTGTTSASGGGGGAGFVYVRYGTLTANSGTITVSGGTGGASSGTAGSGFGGASQTNNGTVGGRPSAGGNGGAGWTSIATNTEFA